MSSSVNSGPAVTTTPNVTIATSDQVGSSSGGALGPYADLPTLNSTSPAASNALKSAYVTGVGFYDCDGIGWYLRGVARLPSGLKAAVLGHSFQAFNTTTPTTDTPVYGATSAQDELAFNPRGQFNWVNSLLGQPFDLVGSFGVAGQSSSQILARVTDVDAVNPDWVFLTATGRNDVTLISTLYASDPVACFNGVIANTTAIWDYFLHKGKVVVDTTISPKLASAGEAGLSKYLVTRLNRALIDLAAQRSGLFLIDVYSSLVDPTDVGGRGITLNYIDSTHPSTGGSFLIAKDIATQIRPFVRPRKSLVSSQTDCIQSDTLSSNVLTALQGLFLGGTSASAGTGVTGTQLTAASINRTAGAAATATASVVAAPVFTDILLDANGAIGNAQRLVITATAAGDTFQTSLPQTLNITQLPAGSKVYAESLVKVTGATNLISVACEIVLTYTGGSPASPRVSRTLYPVSTAFNGTGSASYEAHLRTPKVTLPTGATAVTSATINWYYQFSGAGGATVDVCRASIIKS